MQFAVHYRLGKPTAGGAYTYVDSIIHELAERVGDTRHRMLLYGTGSARPNSLCKPGVSFLDFRKAPDAIAAFVAAVALRRWRGHPFVGLQRAVEYHMQRRFAAVLQRAGTEFIWSLYPFVHTMDIPYAVTVWDLQYRRQGFFPEVSARGEWPLRHRIFEEMLARATYVIASNRTGSHEIERFFRLPSERVVALPHFTPRWVMNSPMVVESGILERLCLQSGKYILYPAQFWPHKNHIRILQALEWLRDTASLKLDAVFVGSDHGNLDYIRGQAQQRGLSNQVHFAGFVTQSDLARLYHHALCLCYASFFGPENLPPLEAFALGCPVTCARYEGAIDQLGDAALYFAPADFRQLAESLIAMGDVKTRRELVAKGLARSTDWTYTKYVERIYELLDNFVAVRECWGIKSM